MLNNECLDVDIIAASRNSAKWLPAMIESILGQEYSRVKLFIQDGASTDNTISVLQQYPLQWSSNPDSGISQAFNRGIEATYGDIIGFICSDDRLQQGAIAAAVEVFQRNPNTIMVYGDCHLTDSGGNVFKVWKSKPFDLDRLFWDNYIPFQTVYINRKALLSIGGFDESLRLAQDWDLWLRLGAKFSADCFTYIPRVQGIYRFSEDTTAWSNWAESVTCHEKALRRFLSDSCAVKKLRFGKDRALAGALVTESLMNILAGKRIAAAKKYINAIKIYPQLILTKCGFGTFGYIFIGASGWRIVKRLQQARWFH